MLAKDYESVPLLKEADDFAKDRPPLTRSQRSFIAAVALFIASGLLVILRNGPSVLFIADLASQSSLTITLQSEYGVPSSMKNMYEKHASFKAIIEPHRMMTISAHAFDSSCSAYTWKIVDIAAGSTVTLDETTSTASWNFGDCAGREIEIKASCGREYIKLTAVGKYVRREVRSLTAPDRELFLDAVHTGKGVSLCL